MKMKIYECIKYNIMKILNTKQYKKDEVICIDTIDIYSLSSLSKYYK